LYGFHGRQEEGQALRCVQLKTGKVMWDVDGYGRDRDAGGRPASYFARERRVGDGASQAGRIPSDGSCPDFEQSGAAYPAIADGRLYARDEHTLVCVRLK